MKEEWIDIDITGKYQVSNLGNVRRFVKYSQSYKLLHPCIIESGYSTVCLTIGGKQHNYFVHRLVAGAFIPNPNNYPCVNHKDEDKSNNKVDNLEWCTHKYNNNYGTRNARISKLNSDGRTANKGSRNGMYGVHRYGKDAPGYGKKWGNKQLNKVRKLTDSDVEVCKELYKTGKYTYDEIGKMYNVTGTTVRNNILGKLKFYERKENEQDS